MTKEGIEDQNDDDIFDETRDFIEEHVDNDTIDDDDTANYNINIKTWAFGPPFWTHCNCTKLG